MHPTVKAGIVAVAFAFATGLHAADEKAGEADPEIVGKKYTFDYGKYAYAITITSKESLNWRLVRGSFPGPDRGDNPYLSSAIADGIIFLSWKEASGMRFYNVMNLKTGKLTTHANTDEGSFVNLGRVTPRE